MQLDLGSASANHVALQVETFFTHGCFVIAGEQDLLRILLLFEPKPKANPKKRTASAKKSTAAVDDEPFHSISILPSKLEIFVSSRSRLI